MGCFPNGRLVPSASFFIVAKTVWSDQESVCVKAWAFSIGSQVSLDSPADCQDSSLLDGDWFRCGPVNQLRPLRLEGSLLGGASGRVFLSEKDDPSLNGDVLFGAVAAAI